MARADSEKRESKVMPLHLRILIEQEEDYFVAHCLELNIVATGASEDEAFREIMDLIRAQIRFAIENDNLAEILRPAPPEVWQKLMRIQQQVGGCRYERTREPAPDYPFPFGRLEADKFCYAGR